jgi:ribose transport system ATP-binding protein
VARGLRSGSALQDVSFELRTGEVLGVVALEGQGQDELFALLSGDVRPDEGEILVDGRPARFRHPADAIAAGLVLVPADRMQALLLQRSVRENVALPAVAPLRRWGAINMGAEGRRVRRAIEQLQIDTRAGAEVRRLSGGNQQKVTIARWLAAGVRTLLCFDPTRGIDVRTKREIYHLVRELAAGGAAILLYTSELEEIQLACDRAIVLFGGRVVDEIAATEATEARLLRAAHGLRRESIA